MKFVANVVLKPLIANISFRDLRLHHFHAIQIRKLSLVLEWKAFMDF